MRSGSKLRATRNAIAGTDLDTLSRLVAREFLELDERERLARSALARLEAGAARRLLELRGWSRGA